MGYWVFFVLCVYIVISIGLLYFWNYLSEPTAQRAPYGVMGLSMIGVYCLAYLISAVVSVRKGDLVRHRTDMIFVVIVLAGIGLIRISALFLRSLEFDPKLHQTINADWTDALQYEEIQTILVSPVVLALWIIYALRHGLLKTHRLKTALLSLPVVLFPVAFLS